MKKIIFFFLGLFLTGICQSQSLISEITEQKIDKLIKSYAHYNRFNGCILVSENNTISYVDCFGYSDVDKQLKNTENSIFRLASLSKTFTAVAILKLAEEGKLHLDTPISNYFPEFLREQSSDIKIVHLLNHSSGIEANIGREDHNGNLTMPTAEPTTLNGLFETFKASKLNFEPGTSFEYNNFCYVLLAHIIEKASGISYSEYVQKNIFDIADMQNSSIDPMLGKDRMAKAHIGLGLDDFKIFNSPIYHHSWLLGASGVNSTIIDLHKFLNALNAGQLISGENMEKMYSIKMHTGVNQLEAGLGWMMDYKHGERWIYSSGLLSGYANIMGEIPIKKLQFIALTNATSVDPITTEFNGKISFEGELVDKIIALMLKNKENPLPIPAINTIDLTNDKTFFLDANHAVKFTKEHDTIWLKNVIGKQWSLFTYTFAQDLSDGSVASKIAHTFAKAFSQKKIDDISQLGTEDMNAFFTSPQGKEQLTGMWDHFVQLNGNFVSYNIYKITGSTAKDLHIRFHFEKSDLGIVLSIDADQKIQGMFMDENVRTSHLNKVELIPIGENRFYINGHKHGGMQDLILHLNNTILTILDNQEKILAIAQ